jgi:hypothetical protein
MVMTDYYINKKRVNHTLPITYLMHFLGLHTAPGLIEMQDVSIRSGSAALPEVSRVCGY